MARRFGFGKREKLKSRKEIDALFTDGKSFPVFPLRVMYRFRPAGGKPGIQAGVSAPKRYFKKAVDRNRIKRLLREAYRLQKAELLESLQQRDIRGVVFFMFTDKTLPDFETVNAAMTRCLQKLDKLALIHEDPS